MKKRLTCGEKWLFGAPLLFLVIVGLVWQRQKTVPITLDLPTSSYVRMLEYSPDSKRLLVSFQDYTDYRHTSRIYDLESHQKVCELATPPSLAASLLANNKSGVYYNTLSWSKDGARLVASSMAMAGNPNSFAIWDANSGANQVDTPYTPADNWWGLKELRFAPNGKTLIGEGVPPAIYDAATGQRLNQSDAGISKRVKAELNGQLGLIAVKNPRPKSFEVLDSKTKRVVWQPQVHRPDYFEWRGDVLGVSDRAIEIGTRKLSDERLLLWDGKSRQQLLSPPVTSGWRIGEFRFNPANRTLAYFQHNTAINKTSLYVREMVVWDYVANRVVWRTLLPKYPYYFQWSPDGKSLSVLTFTSSGAPYHLTIFDQSGNRKFEREPVGNVVSWSPDSKQLAITYSAKSNALFNRVEIIRFED